MELCIMSVITSFVQRMKHRNRYATKKRNYRQLRRQWYSKLETPILIFGFLLGNTIFQNRVPPSLNVLTNHYSDCINAYIFVLNLANKGVLIKGANLDLECYNQVGSYVSTLSRMDSSFYIARSDNHTRVHGMSSLNQHRSWVRATGILTFILKAENPKMWDVKDQM